MCHQRSRSRRCYRRIASGIRPTKGYGPHESIVGWKPQRGVPPNGGGFVLPAAMSVLMRGSVPARRDTFLAGKVSKTMAPGPRPPAGRVRCDARPILRVWNSRLRRSDNQTLAPDCPALLAGAKVAGRAGIEHRYPDGGGATFTLPSIAARRGNQRGVSEPPLAASSRAPRRARSAGESERSADQGNGAGLSGTFGPSLNSPGANMNGAAGPSGRNTGMCFVKAPRRAGTNPAFNSSLPKAKRNHRFLCVVTRGNAEPLCCDRLRRRPLRSGERLMYPFP